MWVCINAVRISKSQAQTKIHNINRKGRKTTTQYIKTFPSFTIEFNYTKGKLKLFFKNDRFDMTTIQLVNIIMLNTVYSIVHLNKFVKISLIVATNFQKRPKPIAKQRQEANNTITKIQMNQHNFETSLLYQAKEN